MDSLPADVCRGTSGMSSNTVAMPHVSENILSLVVNPRGYLRREGNSVRDTVSEALLDMLSIGIVVVNSTRQVVRLNQCARELLKKSTGMQLCGGQLAIEAPDLNRRLAAIVGATCQDSIGSEFFTASNITGRHELTVRVIPLSVGSGLAAVFIYEGDWSLAPALVAPNSSHPIADLKNIPKTVRRENESLPQPLCQR